MNLVTLTLFLVSIVAIPFSVYMLFVLFKYEKNGWIIGFLIWMVISFIPYIFISDGNLLLIVLKFSPLIFFVLYAMILKEKAGEWLMEIEFEKESVLEESIRLTKKDLNE